MDKIKAPKVSAHSGKDNVFVVGAGAILAFERRGHGALQSCADYMSMLDTRVGSGVGQGMGFHTGFQGSRNDAQSAHRLVGHGVENGLTARSDGHPGGCMPNIWGKKAGSIIRALGCGKWVQMLGLWEMGWEDECRVGMDGQAPPFQGPTVWRARAHARRLMTRGRNCPNHS